jgi:hypothetical protein
LKQTQLTGIASIVFLSVYYYIRFALLLQLREITSICFTITLHDHDIHLESFLLDMLYFSWYFASNPYPTAMNDEGRVEYSHQLTGSSL